MIHEQPADDAPVVRLADLPYSFRAEHGSHAVIHVEDAGGGILVVRTRKGERVWTVTAGEELPVFVEAILDQSTVEVDGYPAGTATDVVRVRGYVWG